MCDDSGVSTACVSCSSVNAGWICMGTTCVQGPSRVAIPLLTKAQGKSLQVKWSGCDGYGLPIARYEVQVHINATLNTLIRTDIYIPSPSSTVFKHTIVNLTASTSYFVMIHGCTASRCGDLSVQSEQLSTLEAVVSMTEIGSLVTGAITTAASSTNMQVDESSLVVERAILAPAVTTEVETVVNET